MLVKFGHGGPGAEDGAGRSRYETMQCFALTQPKAMMEEGEGVVLPHAHTYTCNDSYIIAQMMLNIISANTVQTKSLCG